MYAITASSCCFRHLWHPVILQNYTTSFVVCDFFNHPFGVSIKFPSLLVWWPIHLLLLTRSLLALTLWNYLPGLELLDTVKTKANTNTRPHFVTLKAEACFACELLMCGNSSWRFHLWTVNSRADMHEPIPGNPLRICRQCDSCYEQWNYCIQRYLLNVNTLYGRNNVCIV